jgi:two-component system sensor histidine kinase and response regulator WspE
VSDDLSGFSLIELFRMEAESHTATLTTGLVALEHAVVTPERIEPLMRAAHSLKGAARIVGLESAVRVAHAMEDYLVAAQRGGVLVQPHHVDTLFRGIDLLTEIAKLDEHEIGGWESARGAAVDELVAELAGIRANETPDLARSTGSSDIAENGDTVGAAGADTGFSDRSAPGAHQADEQPVIGQPLPASHQKPDSVVRVTAEHLSHLVGLASEALIETQRLGPVTGALWRLKGRHIRLLQVLQLLADRFSTQNQSISEACKELLSEARSEAAIGMRALGETLDAIEQFARRNEAISGRLHHAALTSRMRPLSDGIRLFPRLVRDLARELGKRAIFVTVGETTGVDRDTLDRLEAPLNHLIVNALDHGIEAPDVRAAAGKPTEGTIRLEAHHRVGLLQITLSDDGSGIDVERLRTKIVNRQLMTLDAARQLSETELLDFLFLSGFSTKDAVTEVSGRGVGLDVVQSMVRSVRGSLRVSTWPGKGTRFILQLPISVSVIRALLVEIAGEPYAFPLNRIDRICLLDRQGLRDHDGVEHAMLDDQLVALVDGARVLDLIPGNGRRLSEPLSVVVTSDCGRRCGVVVDRFLGERDMRVWPLDVRLGKVPCISSASVLEDDWPVLFINVEELVSSIDRVLSDQRLSSSGTGH